VKRPVTAAFCCLFAIVFIAGCASSKKAIESNYLNQSSWHGRLALRVQAQPNSGQTQGQAFSAEFDLQGNAQQGDLLFYTPLGSTAAAIHWMPGQAVLRANGEAREFDNLDLLINELLGTEVPVAALFSWLAGQNQDADGWQVDLSAKGQGKISARRLLPVPAAELILLLEN
jgi:outer membrane lipoprotein LolB